MRFLKVRTWTRSLPSIYVWIACSALFFCVIILQSSEYSIIVAKNIPRRGVTGPNTNTENDGVSTATSKSDDVLSGVTARINISLADGNPREHSSTKRSTESTLFDRSQLQRKRHLVTTCARMMAKNRNATIIPIPDWSEMYFDDDRRYIYCLVSKVSCTSWKRTLLWMTGKVPSKFTDMYRLPIGYIHNHKYNDQVMNRMINLEEPEMERRLYGGDYYKFMFVREPLDRLISAYRDKVLADPAYHVGEYILKHHRTKPPTLKKDTGSSTSEPAETSHSSKNITTVPSVVSANVTSGLKPTFAEFVDYVLAQRSAGKRLDRHWLPQWELCSPCLVDYDFIGHQETLHDDAEHVLSVLRPRAVRNATEKPSTSKVADVRFPDSDASRGYDEVELRRRKLDREYKSARVVKQMLAQLSDDTLRRIVDLYGVDYDMFGFERPKRIPTVPSSSGNRTRKMAR